MSTACATCSGSFTARGLGRHVCRAERDRRAVDLYDNGARSVRQVADKLGITIALAHRILTRQGVKLRPPGRDRRPRLVPVRETQEWAPYRCRFVDCFVLLPDDGSHVCVNA